jgi:chromate transporter
VSTEGRASGPSGEESTRPDEVGFWQAFRFWLELGFVSFGGPAGQIAIMHRELVERRRWLSERRFLHALNYCMVLPGPEAQQLATYIGWLMHRTWGGIVAGGLFVLPSLVILVALSWIYVAYGQTPWLAALFYGVKPAVTAIVLHAAYRIGSRALGHGALWIVAAVAFVATFAFRVPFPVVVVAAAVVGVLGGRFVPALFAAHVAHGGGLARQGAALIDDDAPTPAHAHLSYARLALVLGAGLLLWVVPLAALSAAVGWEHMFTRMAVFFTQAALLTFGGAYAVLPYVYYGAVEQFGWLGATQMIDGLALGETTPGPLIMVVAFVGFVGAYGHAVLGPESALLAGVLAALIVTWFTFLPSFVFIFAGGPLVESTRGDLGFVAPLTAITAAVVGVVLDLALFFAYHVFWPAGFDGGVDGTAVAIGLAAGIALFVWKRSVIELIAAGALAGLALWWVPQFW